MSLHTTLPEIRLSSTFRQSQRRLASWLEAEPRAARRMAFGARISLGSVSASERDRLARWLAWLCVAAGNRDGHRPLTRLERLDAPLGPAIRAHLDKLPTAGPVGTVQEAWRHSA